MESLSAQILGEGRADNHQILTLSLSGRLTGACGDRFDAAVGEVIARRPAAIVLDLDAIDFLDWHGLRLIHRLGERIDGEAGLTLVLATNDKQVRNMLRAVELDRRFALHRSRAEALAAVASPR